MARATRDPGCHPALVQTPFQHPLHHPRLPPWPQKASTGIKTSPLPPSGRQEAPQLVWNQQNMLDTEKTIVATYKDLTSGTVPREIFDEDDESHILQ